MLCLAACMNKFGYSTSDNEYGYNEVSYCLNTLIFIEHHDKWSVNSSNNFCTSTCVGNYNSVWCLMHELSDTLFVMDILARYISYILDILAID